ncbi:MAG: type IX secretion system membrane protein PorP/SprF [Saprospiraceae bacterium]|nr:type IX secretion system membrane protein PorP/SprF [Saprospiraceae bacterium]
MMSTHVKFLAIIFLFVETVNSQQLHLNPMLYLDSYMANQSTAGLRGVKVISAIYRSQWEKQSFTPRIFAAHFTSPIKSIKGAYGLTFYNRSHGVMDHNGVKTSYNQVFAGKDVLSSVGLGIQYDWLTLDYSSIRTPEGTYIGSVISHNDPILNQLKLSQQALSLNFSYYLQSYIIDAGVEVGLPFAHIRPSGARIITSEKILKIVLHKEYLYNSWMISGSFYNFSDFKVNQEELRADIRYKNQFGSGFMWRGFRKNSLDAIGTQFSFNLMGTTWLSYQIEWPLFSSVSRSYGITQQFGLKFDLKAKDPLSRYPIIYNPRW